MNDIVTLIIDGKQYLLNSPVKSIKTDIERLKFPPEKKSSKSITIEIETLKSNESDLYNAFHYSMQIEKIDSLIGELKDKGSTVDEAVESLISRAEKINAKKEKKIVNRRMNILRQLTELDVLIGKLKQSQIDSFENNTYVLATSSDVDLLYRLKEILIKKQTKL